MPASGVEEGEGRCLSKDQLHPISSRQSVGKSIDRLREVTACRNIESALTVIWKLVTSGLIASS